MGSGLIRVVRLHPRGLTESTAANHRGQALRASKSPHSRSRRNTWTHAQPAQPHCNATSKPTAKTTTAAGWSAPNANASSTTYPAHTSEAGVSGAMKTDTSAALRHRCQGPERNHAPRQAVANSSGQAAATTTKRKPTSNAAQPSNAGIRATVTKTSGARYSHATPSASYAVKRWQQKQTTTQPAEST